MNRIFRGSLILALGLVGVGFANQLIKNRNVVETETEVEEPVRKFKRKPASESPSLAKKFARAAEHRLTSSRSDDSHYKQTVDGPIESGDREPASANQGGGYGGSYNGQYQSSYGNNRNGQRHEPSRSESSAKNGINTSSNSSLSSGDGVTFSNVPAPTLGDTATNDTPVPDDLSCSASVGGGAFGNPIEVELSCSTTASIKYCLGVGTCCDPETQGATYSSPLVLGAKDGNYCLSFYGETSESKLSTIVSQSYTINNTYPDLQLGFPKTYYQTTQLAGLHYFRSNDFGKANFEAGEINLKTHDPGPIANNSSCQDIVETYVSLPAPAASVVFDPVALSTLIFGDELNVPLVLDKLAYGENFITSYVVNNSYAAPLYSCSTNKVVLNDFSYFVPEVSFGSPTSTIGQREFSGSFVAYGFFEADADVYRGPAGLSKKETNGQELELGSFAVFY